MAAATASTTACETFYDAGNRLALDGCALRERERVNASVLGWRLDAMKPQGPCRSLAEAPEDHPINVALCQRNLRAWDGYGINTCAVDGDSEMRHGSQMTHDRARIQLAKRVFFAGPDLRRGAAAPDAESRMLLGREDTSGVRRCEVLAERDFDRFDPALCPVPVDNIVPPWTRGGALSRDIARSDSFLMSLGYKFDGRIWRR